MVEELIEHALRQRNDPKMGDNTLESIMISDRWMDELKSLPLTKTVSQISNQIYNNFINS